MPGNREQSKIYVPLRKASIGRLNLRRIENSVGEAMPDVIGINRKGNSFWLELKYLDEWPKRNTTFPLNGAFERGQLGFSRQWNDWKGHAYILLVVGKDYILLNPFHQLDKMNKDELLSMATLVIGKELVVKYLENL